MGREVSIARASRQSGLARPDVRVGIIDRPRRNPLECHSCEAFAIVNGVYALTAFLGFLLPLTLYLLVLGLINRRWRPLVVSGPWDFAGILFAVSGFLLLGGPGILAMLNHRWRVQWLLSPPASGQGSASDGYYLWLSLSILYFAIVVAGAAYVLWRRRNLLAIYNVEPAAFEEVFSRILDRLGLPWSRAGQLWCVGFAPMTSRTTSGPAAGTLDSGAFAVELVGRGAQIEVDISSAMRHVSLHWIDADAPARQHIEGELRRQLASVVTRSNPAAGWFLAASACLFSLMTILALATIIVPGIAQR